jgi:hypothetical protein
MCGVLNRSSGGSATSVGGLLGNGGSSLGSYFVLQSTTFNFETLIYDFDETSVCDTLGIISFSEVKRTRFLSSSFSVAASGTYLGGKLLAASSAPFFPDNIIAPINQFQFIGQTAVSPSRSFASGFFVWNRVLFDAERVALDENPWQLFMPQQPAKKTYPVGAPLVLSADAGAYNINGLDFIDLPPASDVRSGVTFGPGGIYVGTLVTRPGETSIAIRSFTRKF